MLHKIRAKGNHNRAPKNAAREFPHNVFPEHKSIPGRQRQTSMARDR